MAWWPPVRRGPGQCARLPQALTSVGHTSRWQLGERVVDVARTLKPGTVIANFVLKDGKMSYPNAHGYHAALFVRGEGYSVVTGKASQIIMFDQWSSGSLPHVPGPRPVRAYTPEQVQQNRRSPLRQRERLLRGDGAMRSVLFAVLATICGYASAQVYSCPQLYPGRDAPAAPLTGAAMMWGEFHGNGYLHGDEEVVQGGYDVHYGFADDEQAWLICMYGGRKRTKGDMGWPGTKWWMQLAPKVGRCDVQVREIKSPGRGESTWTATAICKH